jgi:hypothetical protein
MSTLLEDRVKLGSKVLVVNPSNSYWSLFLTSEVALRARYLGAEVTWINVAKKQSKKFEVNKNDLLPRWRYCDLQKATVVQLQARGINTRVTIYRDQSPGSVPSFKSVSELRLFKFKNINVGAMIYSSVSSALKSTSFEIKHIKRFVRHYLNTAFNQFQAIDDAIEKIVPDLILTVNDRLLGSALTLSLANQHSIEHAVVYWGSNVDSIELYETSLYNSTEWQRKISDHWLHFPPAEFDLNQLKHKVKLFSVNPSEDSLRYLSNQEIGNSPYLDQKTIVFYAQSEYEHSAHFIPDISDRFPNQYVAFRALQDSANRFGYRLILKYHPYPKGFNPRSRVNNKNLDWDSIKIDDSVIRLDEHSSVDTYKLIEESSLNVVWTSTVGLESIARSKSTLILGNTHWLNLDWGIHAWSESDIDSFLSSPFVPISTDSLLPWYWYLDNFGSKAKYASLDGHSLSICGTLVTRERRLIVGIRKLYKFFGSLNSRRRETRVQ